MLALKLAFRNLWGAGLRTWLNVSVLSFAFVVMVFYNGMLDGWNQQALNDTKAWQMGHGQLWHPTYDPYDIFAIQDAHKAMSERVLELVADSVATPILISQGAVYPQGRMINAMVKGIDPRQTLLKLPTRYLEGVDGELCAIIGKRMAKSARLAQGDRVLVRWRDAKGTFDAREVLIANVFSSDVPMVDMNTFWVPLAQLQQMTGMDHHATYLVLGEGYTGKGIDQWQYKDLDALLADLNSMMAQEKAESRVVYGLLLALALLAVFDTQVLSIFRRQKEIGTYIALGMTRWQVVRIFTVEGSAHSILALLVGAVYGIPVLTWFYYHGIPMPDLVDAYGIAISKSIMPVYSAGMVASSIALVIVSSTIVSYFPAHKITKIRPTDALKGKLQ